MKIFLKFFLIGYIFLYSISSISQCIPETPSNPITISGSGYAGRTITYSDISLNGGTNFAEVEPGDNFTVSFNYYNSPTYTYCPGCVVYLYVGVAGASYLETDASPRQNTECVGSIGRGSTGSQNSTFIAPDEPGYYYISGQISLVFRCYQFRVTHTNCGSPGRDWNIGLIKVGNPPSLAVSASSVINATSCNGSDGSIDIDVTGGVGCYQYLWSNGETTQDVSNLSAGSYSVTITDKGCTETQNFTITETDSPIIDTPINIAACDSFQLPVITGSNLVSPAYYTGPNKTGTTYNEGDLIYTSSTLYIYDETSTAPKCIDEESFTITINSTITPTFTQVDPICSGDVLALPTTSNNGVTGTWSPAMDNTATTIYTFVPDTTQPGQACAVNQTMTITVNPITPNFTQVAAICNGEALAVLITTSDNGITGTWSPAIDNTATTLYTFVPDATQPGQACAVNQTMTITVNQAVIPIFDSVAAICEGESLTNLPTTSANGVSGTWSPAMNNMATTNYTFTPDASEICAETATLEIAVNEIININLGLRIVVNKLDHNQSVAVYVANTVGFYEYKLDGGLWQDSNLFENLIVGKYSITVREKSDCSNESTILFLLIDYPRFFTPNGDGINDTWNVEGLESQPKAVITIFDRFGKTLSVFRADELGWNGIWNGKSMPSNSYWFKVSYFENEDRPKTLRSNFSLLRE